jgi:hypothetical protein
MQRTIKREEEGIMGKVFRILWALSALVLAGAACSTCPEIRKETASVAKQMVVVTIDPETGAFTVQDSDRNPLKSAEPGQPRVGTLTSPKPVTITIDLSPAGSSGGVPILAPTSETGGASGGASSAMAPKPAPVSLCRIVIINGKVYCR